MEEYKRQRPKVGITTESGAYLIGPQIHLNDAQAFVKLHINIAIHHLLSRHIALGDERGLIQGLEE